MPCMIQVTRLLVPGLGLELVVHACSGLSRLLITLVNFFACDWWIIIRMPNTSSEIAYTGL